MSNGTDQQQNCVLQICCGGDDGAKQKAALVELIRHDLPDSWAVRDDELAWYASWIVEHYDLAEKGTLLAFKTSIAKYARGFPYEG